MREQFQAIEWDEPPVGDLVEKSVARGRRMRAARRLRLGGVAGLVVLAVAGASIGVVSRAAGRSVSAPAAITAPAAPQPSSSTTPGDDRVKATPAGLLELLLQTLPPGRTSHYAGAPSGRDTIMQTFLDRGHGPGMIRVNVIDSRVKSTATWTPLSNGVDYLIQHVPGNCLQSTVVVVRHPGNLMVQFNLSTCPIFAGVHMRPVLSVQEAIHAGADPRWGVTIDPALNAQGASRFPHLSTDFPSV